VLVAAVRLLLLWVLHELVERRLLLVGLHVQLLLLVLMLENELLEQSIIFHNQRGNAS
jgi:hypothetical protein